MSRTTTTRAVLAAAFTLAPAAAFAHPGAAHVHSLAEGIAHPFTGADHLLAMVAVGLIAARAEGRAVVAAPAAFVASMVAGAGLGLAGVALPQVETGIALSLIVFGALVALARPVPVGAGAALAAAFGLFHGFAHGSEGPQGGAALAYMAGFVAATALLHGAGVVAGRGLLGRVVPVATGVAAAALGALSLAPAL